MATRIEPELCLLAFGGNSGGPRRSPQKGALTARQGRASTSAMTTSVQRVRAGVLDVAYEAHGPAGGPVAVLLHGFPYDPRCYDEVAPLLAARGLRVIVPYLRGYGPTRFADAATPRSGEQAVLGMDLIALLDALKIGRAVLAGYDWGGRAACVVAALWPERAAGLVTGTGYNIQDIAAAAGSPATSPNRCR